MEPFQGSVLPDFLFPGCAARPRALLFDRFAVALCSSEFLQLCGRSEPALHQSIEPNSLVQSNAWQNAVNCSVSLRPDSPSASMKSQCHVAFGFGGLSTQRDQPCMVQLLRRRLFFNSLRQSLRLLLDEFVIHQEE